MADIILSSNAIFTGNENKPFKGAIAIRNNRILAVGTDEEIQKHITQATKIINYDDNLIMPGFNDLHIHLFLGSLSQDSVSLGNAKSEEEAAQMVKAFADERPNDSWIFGFNWYHVYWENQALPHRTTLDKYISDRPVFLINDECHGAWVNSKALKLMGINKDTPNPPFGEIVKDKNGEPTGFLYETAMTFAQRAFDDMSMERQDKLLQDFQDYAASLGVTSVSDMLPLPRLELGNLALYNRFDEEDKLKTRIHFLAALDGNLDHVKKLRATYHSPKVMFSGLKQFLDGVPTAYTALMVDPYTDKPNTKGDTLIPTEYVKKWVVEADKKAFRIRLHACGDGAVRLGLDCFEMAEKINGKRDARHTIEHIEVIHEDDLTRFEKLGVIASVQPEHLAYESEKENVYPIRLGPERERFAFPMKTLQNMKMDIAYGSDFPVVDLNPLFGVYRAVTRVHDDGAPANGWNPQEKIPLAEALRHYTIGSAYGVFREHELGTLEAGKLADIVVLDRNLFAVDPREIQKSEVLLTMMDGEIVFEK